MLSVSPHPSRLAKHQQRAFQVPPDVAQYLDIEAIEESDQSRADSPSNFINDSSELSEWSDELDLIERSMAKSKASDAGSDITVRSGGEDETAAAVGSKKPASKKSSPRQTANSRRAAKSNDGGDGAAADSDDALVLVQSSKKGAAKSSRRTKASGSSFVQLDSDEEDASEIKAGDSMYNRSSAVKSRSVSAAEPETVAKKSPDEQPTSPEGHPASPNWASPLPSSPVEDLRLEYLDGSEPVKVNTSIMADMMAEQMPLFTQTLLAQLGPLLAPPLPVGVSQPSTSNETSPGKKYSSGSSEQPVQSAAVLDHPVSTSTPDTARANIINMFSTKPSGKNCQVRYLPLHSLLIRHLFIYRFSSSSLKRKEASDQESSTPSRKKTKDLYLEDISSHRVKYIPVVPCQVNDIRLQDPLLRPTYVNLPGLSGDCLVLPSFDRSAEDEPEGRVGGRLQFTVWAAMLGDASPSTLFNAVTFVLAFKHLIGPQLYINPSRVSPGIITMRPAGGVNQFRISVDNHGAVCVSSGMCTESHIIDPVASSGVPARYRKFICLMLHNQDWERWAAFMCHCFGYKVMHCAMTAKAIQLGTRISPIGDSARAGEQLARRTNSSIFKYLDGPAAPSSSSGVSSSSAGKQAFGTSHSLKYDDTGTLVPVYDARNVEFDFNKDIASLAQKLPVWKEEIPVGSFIVAGYSTASFMGGAQGVNGKTIHIGCNILWVVLCGTSDVAESDADYLDLRPQRYNFLPKTPIPLTADYRVIAVACVISGRSYGGPEGYRYF
ncbi:hypothetical protein C8R46DRAFT_1216805 [Mycena filopes]|nr:hypothetical protein C8R46DRAFT_1216805 [Mycena filopes]